MRGVRLALLFVVPIFIGCLIGRAGLSLWAVWTASAAFGYLLGRASIKWQ